MLRARPRGGRVAIPYSAIEVEGLFPTDLLERVAIGDIVLGQTSSDFNLPSGTRLTDEFQGAYSDIRAHWDAFQRRRAHSQSSLTTITREAWVGPLLERLGYDLTFQRSASVDGESFLISHRAGQAQDAPPVNVLSVDQELDDRLDGSRRTPHAAVQEYLNRTDVVWGIVTNGDRLRLLRSATRISRPTYLEFDLTAIVEDNLYSEFVLFYRLLHRTRLPRTASDTESWIERYYQQGIEEGGRVRERLRGGVERAITQMANALLEHRSSEVLRQRVVSGDLPAADLYRQLLRLVYRLLFLMVVEERKLVVPVGVPGPGPDIYLRHYGLSSLRERAEHYIAPDPYTDLWLRLIQVFAIFRDQVLARSLGLIPFDGELFSAAACADLEIAYCANDAVLRSIRALSTFDDEGVRRRVNFAGLDVEELGSVYEALLEYAPHIDTATQPPRFVFEAGAERRSTGSYYTPQSLVEELVEAALVPVLAERLALAKDSTSRERALLSLHVMDLASGSGHFLLAAGRRIARELAKVRAAGNEPSPADFRHALREVIRSCLYAVDKNPLAVDLCKVALWLESHEAGLPLAFLDHRVKLGDSVVGVATLSVLDEGIPDEAYQRLDRSIRPRSRTLRDRNHREREGQLRLLAEPRAEDLSPVSVVEAIAREPDDTVERVRDHAARYASAREIGGAWWHERVSCDLWTAPFFADLRRPTPTTAALQSYRTDPENVDDETVDVAIAAASGGVYRAFHWPVEFPDVAAAGGFDVILSNPPFMGGQKISGNFGDQYRNYLVTNFPPAGGTADLCAFFFRRAFSLLRSGGRLGMIGTKTIHEGDTREAGLLPILAHGGIITSARRSLDWPLEATVQVDLVSISRGPSRRAAILDGREVASISSRLDDETEAEAASLRENHGRAFQGSIVLGLGFVLDPADAEALIQHDPRNRECLFPYINGDDLNSRPDQTPSRWVINFGERSEAEARAFVDLWALVEERVQPERTRAKDRRASVEWWKHLRPRPELHEAIRLLSRVLARTRHSEIHALAFLPKDWVYDGALVVFAFESDYEFAVLQSGIHEAWVRRYASHLRSDVRYTPTDCFETFPFPQDANKSDVDSAALTARDYDAQRSKTMRARRLGLTKTYNLVNDERCTDIDIQHLRDLHAEMDRLVLACYGWSECHLGHGFYRNERDQLRFTISPDARRDLLRRLLRLNAEVAGRSAR